MNKQANLNRCSRRGLPETYETIEFDKFNVCNICHQTDFKQTQISDQTELN